MIRERIDRASVTIVYLTEDSSKSDWVNWEITESLKRGKGVIGVYKGDAPPAKLPKTFQQGEFKIVKWDHTALLRAIEEASVNR